MFDGSAVRCCRVVEVVAGCSCVDDGGVVC
jgi:hypothetical protein